MKRVLQIWIVWIAAALVATAQDNAPTAPDLGELTSSNMLPATRGATNPAETEQHFQMLMDLARRQRQDKDPSRAEQTLVSILETNAPPEFQRKALFELALAAQDNNESVKAQQVFAQYMQRYPDDPSVPEVLLRQGLLYRQMGVNTLAISKFYAVMSTALKLKLDDLDYYKNLVLQAQTEIADTYYIQGQFAESADFFARLIKSDRPGLNKEQIEYKLIRSLSYLTNRQETIIRAQSFLEQHTTNADTPEVRFILASAYKAAGRNQDALNQVLLLLQSQQDNVHEDPELWTYWQRRAGNEIANQLYKESDYLDALQIYQNLAPLDKSAAWQTPVWYQIGLVYEQLQQWQKATDTYDLILARRAEMTGTNAPPSLSSLCEMAQWRKDFIAWTQKAREANRQLQHAAFYKPPPARTNLNVLK